MKKLFILLLAVPLLSFNIQTDNSKFIGKWAGEDGQEIGYLSFDAEGYAYFEIQGQIMGGKEFVQDGQKGSMTYEINSETNPIQVDLIVMIFESKERKKLLCIANFIDSQTRAERKCGSMSQKCEESTRCCEKQRCGQTPRVIINSASR